MKKLILSTALATLMALPAFASAQAQEPKQGGDMVVTYKDDVATLDPAIGYDWQNWSMIKSVFVQLRKESQITSLQLTNLTKAL